MPCKSSDPLGVNHISQTDIMKAILETTGPVTTALSLKAVKRSMHLVSSKQFVEAAEELEKCNCGQLLKMSMGSRVLNIFIKRPPPDIESILRSNPHLGIFEIYAARYGKAPSKAIGLQLRAKLVALKLVSKNCFM